MKTRIILFFIALLALLSLANAESDRAYADRKVQGVNIRIDSLKKVVNDTTNVVSALKGTVAEHDKQLTAQYKTLVEQKQMLVELNQTLANQKAKLQEQQYALDTQSQKINELIGKLNETRSLLDEKLPAIDQLGQKTGGTETKTNLMLFILLPVAALVFFFAVFFFWPRQQTSLGARSGSVSGLPTCPRCGWEHAPTDTVCKNPKCKTHF